MPRDGAIAVVKQARGLTARQNQSATTEGLCESCLAVLRMEQVQREGAAGVFWRAYLVLAKPVDELVGLLGLEVPTPPHVSLAAVKSDAVILHWKPPDQRNAVVKYQVQCNGSVVGEVSQQETSVIIETLRPDHFYTIRVVSVNASSFQAASAPVRLKTKDAASGDRSIAMSEPKMEDSQDPSYCMPTVRLYKSFIDTSPTPAAPTMTRESSGTQLSTKRGPTGRRTSPIITGSEHNSSSADQSFEGEGTIRQLTEVLEDLRESNEEVERQIADEEEQFEHARLALSRERDVLRHSLKDREDVTKELRRQVGNLERANAAAQNRKSQQERALQSKRGERKRMNDEMARWDKETGDMRSEIEHLQRQCAQDREAGDRQLQRLRDKQECELQAIKQAEEDLRQKGIQIKELDVEAKRQAESETEEDVSQRERNQAEEEKSWDEKFQSLQAHYTSAWNKFQQAERTYREVQARLEFLTGRRAGQTIAYPPSLSSEGHGGRAGTQHIRRAPGVRHDTSSSTGSVFSATESRYPFGPSLDSAIASASPRLSSPPSYFGTLNGTGVGSIIEQTVLLREEVSGVNREIPMSPSAGTLIPSDLLGDDVEGQQGPSRDRSEESLDSYPERFPGTNFFAEPGPLPGLGAPQMLDRAPQDPNTPSPIASRPPSLFQSPRDSVGHLHHHYHQASDSFNESDRRSIRSTSGSFRSMGAAPGVPAPASRFANLFGIRTRGKTMSDESPALGALKGSQTQSMPRSSDDDLQEFGGPPRRRTSYSGSMLNSVWNRGNGNRSSTRPDNENREDGSKMPSPRKNPFHMFSQRRIPWSASVMDAERSSSPRPASTYSMENALPRPSAEFGTQPFGWANSDNALSRPGPFGAEWSYASTSSWSHHPSRRSSVHYGNSLSHEMPLLEGDTTELGAEELSPQPPIGTRPTQPRRAPSPQQKLNPAARDFKSLFSYKKSDKAEKPRSKGKGKEKATDSGPESSVEGASPPENRKSKDKQYGLSFSTDSGEPLDRLDSGTAPDVTPSASSAKGFIQKMSRKGSSGKFSLPSFKDKGLFSKKGGETGTPDETDEDGSSLGKLSRSFESLSSSPQVGSNSKSGASYWGSFRKKGKKGDKTPSISETSMASEAGLEEEDEGEGLFG